MERVRALLIRRLHPEIGQGESYSPERHWSPRVFCAGGIRLRFPDIGHARRIVLEVRPVEYDKGRVVDGASSEVRCCWMEGRLIWYGAFGRVGHDDLTWEANGYLGSLGLFPDRFYWVRVSRI